MNIEKIENSKFLKKLNNNELANLAINMRQFILENVSKTGGHLSSNLGIVDLTIAMLKVFDVEKDIILFDVGHECYPYKILTGRAGLFDSLRQKDGLSGFMSMKESKYDKYETGHSGTSISSALGYAIARDLNKKNYDVISVIGDGSIANGLAYEALNHLGSLKTKQIIILNDNNMSISKNVGAIHNMLDKIRANAGYKDTKNKTKKVLNKTKVGKTLYKSLDYVKSSFKRIYLKKGKIFSEFGIDYFGPINGHDYKELLQYLTIAKNSNKSVFLHVITEKGKGYPLAENDTIGKFHGISPFNVETGELLKKDNLPSFSEIVSSYVYNFAKKDNDIICITPAMSLGSKLDIIKEKLPKQYIDVGICEEHALVMANTLALAGKRPFVFIYSTFLQRGYDALVHDIARCKSPVTLLIDRAGLVPADGASHQGLFDIPMMMNIPNMVITCAKDSKEANDLIFTSLNNNLPFAIRYNKVNLKYDYNVAKNLKIGSWEILKKGNNGTIITYGQFCSNALNIAEKQDLEVVNARFIKPIDEEMFKMIIQKNKPIFVYEESQKIGSLGNFLAQKMCMYKTNSTLHIFAVEDKYLTHASRDELIKMCSLDEDSIIRKIGEILNVNNF